MSQTERRTPTENLQLLIDRYSLSGTDFEPTVQGIANADARYMGSIGPRRDYLYGELTKRGLVHVWANHGKSQFARAEVLVVDNSFVNVYHHELNRHNDAIKRYDWSEDAGRSFSVPLHGRGDELRVETLSEILSGKTGDQIDYARDRYERVARALARFAEYPSSNDALHQLAVWRTASEHPNLSPLFPYAGQTYGPRVNLEEMREAGVHFHESVVLALDDEKLPKMDNAD